MAVTYSDIARTPPVVAARALRARLVPAFEESAAWGWAAPILITLVGAYLRFNRLSVPGSKAFDEVYYTHDSLSLLHHGVELNNTDNGPGFVVHPPLGKWMIAVGEALYGDNSYGWRFSSAVVGTIAILIVARTARRMARSTLIGCLAAIFMTFDGLELVQSRTSMLDIFLMFWVVVAFACLVLDRDQVRARLVAKVATDADFGEYGPRVGMRWWLLACGVSVGAATACKWDGLYYIPAFATLALAWTVGAKRAIGVRQPLWSTVRRDLGAGVAWFFCVPLVVYVASWTGWFLDNGKYAWDRNWANGRSGLGWIPAGIRNPLRGLWHYHWEAYNFHVHLTSYHQYRSNAWGWLFETRPVLYYADYPHAGRLGCTNTGSGCARMIYDMGTPAIWWASIPVMLFMLYLVFRRDWRASAVLVPFLFGFLPWLRFFKRTMFYFYALPLLPFVCIALAITIGYMIGPRDSSPNRRMVGAAVGGAYVLLVVVLFFYFLPIMTERTIPFTSWENRMWLNSWGEDHGS